jgi:hypothetical protein
LSIGIDAWIKGGGGPRLRSIIGYAVSMRFIIMAVTRADPLYAVVLVKRCIGWGGIVEMVVDVMNNVSEAV